MTVKRRRPALVTRPRCVLDSGALSVLVGRSQRARAWLRWIVEHDGTLTVPTPVLVETITGDSGRDAEVNRILGVLQQAASVIVAPDEATARRAGRLRYRARSDDGIDALVAAAAVGDGSPCVVLTSDRDDLARLLTSEPQIAVRGV
jgi:predicted nucleic acid-binding protein